MSTVNYIDTHCHLDGEEFDEDREAVIKQAREAGVCKIFLPAIDLTTSQRIHALCAQYPDYLYPMAGLHPEEVRADWQAFEEQVRWSVELQLPLMIHCRKAQNELVAIIKKYASELPGGVFHCFTGNELEAEQLLQFDRFVLGIGGVLTFKKSHLPEVLPKVVPLDRIVLETDAPYMAPVPMRGKRNEPAFTRYVLSKLAESYGVSEEEIAIRTNANVMRVFNLK